MGKPSKSANSSVPAERKIKTRSVSLRKNSIDESLENQLKPLLEESALSQKNYQIAQAKSKYFPYHEDIDMYFASCFTTNFKSKDESNHSLEKESTTEKNYKENKKPNIFIQKQDISDEGAESQVKSSLASIEEGNESQKQNFEQESPESPIFGRKMMKNLRTPPNKLEDFKDFDQSEEVVRKNFIDQLEEVSKDVSSPSDNRPSSSNPNHNIINTIEFSSPVFKTQKRISKRKNISQNRKNPPHEDYFPKPDVIEFSFRRHGVDDEARRRSQILRLSTLKSVHTKYERSERILMSLDNAMKSLMNYYNLRELNTKVLSFRTNVFKLCKYFLVYFREEIERMMVSIREKKEICQETIQEKSKNGNEVVHYYDQKMNFPEI